MADPSLPPSALDLGFELLPADEEEVSPEAAAEAAAASSLDDPTFELPDEPPEPFGRSWAFDWERGQFVRRGDSPAEVHELAALREWCLMAIYSERYGSAVFSDEFGMQSPDDLIGEAVVPEMLADWEQRLTEALLVHDRITSVENFEASFDPETGVVTIESFDVTTDEADALSLAGEQLTPRGVE